MIHVLFYLLLLEICLAQDTNNVGESRSKNLSDVRQIIMDENTHSIRTVAYYGPPGVPSFPDVINCANISLPDQYNRYNWPPTYEYYSMRFYNFSSAYSLKHKINLEAQQINTRVSLGNMRIRGRTYLKDHGDGVFDENFDRSILSCNTALEFQNGSFIFEKREWYFSADDDRTSRSIAAQTGRRNMPTSVLYSLMSDLCQVVRNATFLGDLRSQIQREISNMYRNAISRRFRRKLVDVFKNESIHSDEDSTIHNQLHFDTTNFQITHKVRAAAGKMYSYDLRIPSFQLRGSRALDLSDLIVENITSIENEFHLRAKFHLPSPLLEAKIVYRDELRDQNKTLKAVYQLTDLAYILGMVARLDTESVDIEYTRFEPSHFGITLPADPVISDDEKLDIIEEVRGYLQRSSFIATNCERTFRHYIESVLPLEQIAAEIFTA